MLDHAALYRDGCFATLRLTAGMYHHFHAPHDLAVEAVRYMAGDLWNVNPTGAEADREAVSAATSGRRSGAGWRAASRSRWWRWRRSWSAGMRLPFLGVEDLREGGTRTLPTDARFAKGERMGWFEHGSTIILFAPAGFRLAPGVGEGTRIKAGEPLMQLP